MLKCQFHIHVKGDPVDNIKYTAEEMILEAKRLGYDVLAITSHKKVLHNEHLRKFAEERGILLLSGIELKLKRKDVLAINVDTEIEKIKTLQELREYKNNHSDCLIIAPHPFFPGFASLGKDLEKNIDIFDAIENSFCYTTTKNYNKKAIKLAEKYNKPLIATSDCHILKYFDLGYTLIEAEKSASPIKQAIISQKIKNSNHPIPYHQVAKILLQMGWQNILKKLK